MTDKTEAIAKLRHLYDNLAHGGVRDTSQAKRIAEGLLAPAIEALEVELRRQHAEIQQLKAENARLQPTIEDDSQEWAKCDPAIAFHLIDRHADNWADAGKMMTEFADAKAEIYVEGYTAEQMHAYVDLDRAVKTAPQAQPADALDGWRLVPVSASEEMHIAAVKVLHRASGLDGLPQRMLDAMLSSAPPPPEREPLLPDFPVENRRSPSCWCETCRPVTLSDMRMVLCPDCGNKRCPKATHHDNACTNSNAPGQPGSSWEHVKPHGATND